MAEYLTLETTENKRKEKKLFSIFVFFCFVSEERRNITLCNHTSRYQIKDGKIRRTTCIGCSHV
jgi:hypothetical protein